MDFRFSQDQSVFKDAIRDFLKGECTPKAVRESWDAVGANRAAALMAGLAEMGLTRLTLPEDQGGLGLNELDAVIAAEECGYAALPLPIIESTSVAAALLVEANAGADWVQRVSDGKATLALHHDVNGFATDDADAFILKAGDALYLVPKDAAKLEPINAIDSSRRPVRVTAPPDAKFKIAEGKQAALLWDGAFDRAALYAAADMLGAAQRMLGLAVEYVGQRKQFGKPIGSFQAVKHLLADVQVKLTFAKPVVYHAAYLAARHSSETSLRISHAKVAAGDAAMLAVRRTFQVHGAIGYTWEYDLQIWMKRVWATVATWGTAAWHRDRLAQTVLAPNADLGAGRTWAA